MNGCEDIQTWLSAYLDGEVTARRREAIEAHLAGCDACRQELASLCQVSACLQVWQAPEARPELSARFAERLAAKTTKPETRWLAGPWLRAAGVAGLAACLMVAVFVTRHKEAPYQPPIRSTSLPQADAATQPDVTAKGDNSGAATRSATGAQPHTPATPTAPPVTHRRLPRPVVAKDPGPAMGKVNDEEHAVDPVLTAVNALNETTVVDGAGVALADGYSLANETIAYNGKMGKAGLEEATLPPIEANYENQPELLAIALITEAP
ncbi:MAG: anti-sigma factor family protein [Armatimonadota bacterium]